MGMKAIMVDSREKLNCLVKLLKGLYSFINKYHKFILYLLYTTHVPCTHPLFLIYKMFEFSKLMMS